MMIQWRSLITLQRWVYQLWQFYIRSQDDLTIVSHRKMAAVLVRRRNNPNQTRRFSCFVLFTNFSFLCVRLEGGFKVGQGSNGGQIILFFRLVVLINACQIFERINSPRNQILFDVVVYIVTLQKLRCLAYCHCNTTTKQLQPSSCALILYSRRLFINHLLTYLLTYLLIMLSE